jgi:hypothetical protein
MYSNVKKWITDLIIHTYRSQKHTTVHTYFKENNIAAFHLYQGQNQAKLNNVVLGNA